MSDDGTTTPPPEPGGSGSDESELVEELVERLEEERAERKRLSGWLIGLVSFIGVLLIGLIVLLVLLLLRGQANADQPTPTPIPIDTPAALVTPDPSETPEEAPTPGGAEEDEEPPVLPQQPPPPAGPDGRIVSFSAPTTVGCFSPEAPAYQDSVDITFSWQAQNVSVVAFGVATSDAIDAPYQTDLAPSGSLTIGFPCSNSSQLYTLTVAGADGVHVSSSVTVNNPSAGG